MQVAKRCCRKKRVVYFLQQNLSAHVARFTGLRQTCFSGSVVTHVFVVTSA